MPRHRRYKGYKKHRQDYTKGATQGVAHSNPLLFPRFQCILAGFLLKRHPLEKLSKIFKSEAHMKSTVKKTSNQNRIAAFLINQWVHSTSVRPKFKDVVDLFQNDDHTKRDLKCFSEQYRESIVTEYTGCSKDSKSFQLLKLIITKMGDIIGICPYHGTKKLKVDGKWKWCCYMEYNGDTIDESERPLQPFPSSCSPTVSPTDVLNKNCCKIVEDLCADPNRFTNAFLGENLVSQEIMEKNRELNETKRQKAERIHTELLRTVTSHESYDKFISVLKNEPMCTELLKTIPSSLSG